jgi:hypothetical protein
MTRRPEIDAVRGLMLVWMTATHLPTVLSTYSNQTFGFVSASEGFIFLSALFTGLIYSRVAEREGLGAMRRKLWSRTVRLYGYHALLLAFTFLVAVPIASRGNRPGLHNLLDFYFAVGPKRAITEAALLIYRPPLLDILPMYVIFLLATPVALTLAKRIGWSSILSAAITVWALAQLGLRQVIYDLSHLLGVRIPLNEMGSFDLWAWQLCWIMGLWCGVRWAQGDWDVESWARRLTVPVLIIAPVLLVVRYAASHGLDLGWTMFLVDKWHFGAVRIINFVAVAALMIRFQAVLKPLAVRPLVMLGQSSLQVFCVHLLFCFAGLTLLGSAAMLSGWRQFWLAVTTYSAMLLTAKIFSKSEAKIEAKPGRPAATQIDHNAPIDPGLQPQLPIQNVPAAMAATAK